MEDESRKAEAPPSAIQAGDDETANDLPPIMTVEELAAFLRLNRDRLRLCVARRDPRRPSHRAHVPHLARRRPEVASDLQRPKGALSAMRPAP